MYIFPFPFNSRDAMKEELKSVAIDSLFILVHVARQSYLPALYYSD